MADELLTVAEMGRADRAAMAAGVPGTVLMERAGAAVAAAALARWSPRPVAVLCGPGNNGGDGFVAARLLAERGWPVRLALLGEVGALRGDAAWAASGWTAAPERPVERLETGVLDGAGLVIDALFGAGLSRPLTGPAADLVMEVGRRGLPVLAVDVPSGVRGDDGAVLGCAPRADLTVTFHRRKPAHVLLPGRLLCGEVVLADIGIPDGVVEAIAPRTWENGPRLWGARYPWPRPEGHKYSRGHALVSGGAVMTGAARLAARAALRAGAGLVTIAVPPETVTLYALSLPSAIVLPAPDGAAFEALLDDPRRNAVLLGPGAGAGEALATRVLAALARDRSGVLDADVFTSFAGGLEPLALRLHDRWVLTPHDGEFDRLFGPLPGSRLDRARAAARACGAVVLLKGADTVVAHPDGRATVTTNAPPDLATAGSGDVLAGLIVGLLAQGMDGFDAACAGAWLHGEAGSTVGPGLIAEDLPEALPAVLRRLKAGADA
ncbi:NAD(P)H-hydrate dehydratase [Rhodocista pekingensis]|uniref:Bifunctional NAD(P)H-hydrate repair enzyme n=1 Tax=Rhodocista pekingensis TaxID=201185 RepID=A0ABW2KRY3_9PROT